MKDNNNNKIDFSYIDFPISDNTPNNKKPFIEHVETVLIEDLQHYNKFGCRIQNCHTHTGSKLHFDSFIEAELLFHNSYYNQSFAVLTKEYLEKQVLCKKEYKKTKNILLIGYETYSEMYLQELKDLLNNKKIEKRKYRCEYCVYETTSKMLPSGERKHDVRIRNLHPLQTTNNIANREDASKYIVIEYGENPPKYQVDETLCIFIVPINTSLSTMDKMIAKFYETLKTTKSETPFDKEYICLITVGNGGAENKKGNKAEDEKEDNKGNKKESAYFTVAEQSANEGQNTNRDQCESKYVRFLIPAANRFEYLEPESQVANFVAVGNDKVNSKIAQDCPQCFPKDQDNNLITEQPLFNVNRGSVVPMLKLDSEKPLEPLDAAKYSSSKKNLNKVIKLSKFLTYRHIVRDNNHFQYYLDTEKYLQDLQANNNKELFKFFEQISEKLKMGKNQNQQENESNKQIFDYLVAPRHETNAIWVHLVNKHVFNNTARIIHLDIEKEFRSNIQTKYSDLTASLENIKNSGQKCQIRFHYIDDAIYSGNTFLRAKNLFLSLTSSLRGKDFSLFDTIITLIQRISPDTQRFYLDNIDCNNDEVPEKIEDHFFAYVRVNLSPMRKYEDACTLCKLRSDYHIIRDHCATNRLSDICSSVIIQHQMDSHNKNIRVWKEEEIENRYIFIITHLLNERLHNLLCFEPDAKPIDTAKDCERMKALLVLYYYVFGYDDNSSVEEALRYLSVSQDLVKDAFKPLLIALQSLEDLLETEGKKSNLPYIYQVAFIKAISRPFFTYPIRFRQAAFSFCLKELDSHLRKDENKPGTKNIRNEKSLENLEGTIYESYLIQTLVKALCDMNASYLVRKSILNRLLEHAKEGDLLYKAYDEETKDNAELGTQRIKYYKKAIFTSDSLIHYIKKDIVLSNDETKALYLENILLNEEDEFPKEKSYSYCGVERFYCYGANEEANQAKNENKISFVSDEHKYIHQSENEKDSRSLYISPLGRLYLENNEILKAVLGRDGDLQKVTQMIEEMIDGNNKVKRMDSYYFFDYFDKLWKINDVSIEDIIFNHISDKRKKDDNLSVFHLYQTLLQKIRDFSKNTNGDRKDFSQDISQLFKEITGDPVQTLAFVHDKSEEGSILFKYFTLAGNPSKRDIDDSDAEKKNEIIFMRDNWYKDLTTIQAFFHDDNIREIDKVINNESRSKEENDIFFIDDKLFFADVVKKALVVRFGKDIDVIKMQDDDAPCALDADARNKKAKKDESIYVQIWDFDINNVRHWFALKLLLSLRKDISDLIVKVNLQELIDERKVETKQAALSINKSATHSNSQKYMFPSIVSETIPGEVTDSDECIKKAIMDEIGVSYDSLGKGDQRIIDYLIKEKTKKRTSGTDSEILRYMTLMQFSMNNFLHKRTLFDRYFQLLADEVLSSLYRKIIRTEIRITDERNLKDHLKNLYQFEDEEGKPTIHMAVYNTRLDKLIDCSISFDFRKDIIPHEYNNVGNISPFVFIIILTAVNTVLHTESAKVEVILDEDCLVMKNHCDQNEYNKNEERYWHIAPWLFKDPHITVWTLLHMSSAMDMKIQEGRWIDCLVDYNKEEIDTFTTTFIFRGGGKE